MIEIKVRFILITNSILILIIIMYVFKDSNLFNALTGLRAK